jgi:hypothetical protein
MDKELFKKILKPQIASLSAKNPSEAAEMVAKAYDKALKSKAFTQSGQKFLNSDVSGLESVFKYGFELNNLSRQLSSSVEPGWQTMAIGISKYWLTATFNLLPPSPPAASTTNILVTFPGDIKKLPEKLKFAFNQGDTEKFVETLADVLINYQSKIAGQYIGVSANGVPVVKPWIGVFGDNPSKQESRKNNNIIPLLKTTTFKPINDGAGYTVKTLSGPFGKYAARVDSSGKPILPAAANDLQSTQKNGRLNLNLLVMVDDGNAILEKNCANAYIKMQKDAKDQGVELKLKFTKASSGYRSLGRAGDLKFREDKKLKSVKHRTQYAAREDYDLCVRQKGVAACKRRMGAPVWPDRGGSNHGWGRAIDIGPRATQDWIRINGWRYGWYWGEAPSEEWHFTWVLSAGIDKTLGPGKFYLYDEKGNINPSDY